MSRRALLIFGGVVVALGAVGILVSLWSGASPAASSTLSRGGSGWMGVRLWLEDRGAAVELLDRPLAGLPAEGTLVIAFPWQRGATLEQRLSPRGWTAELGEELRRRVARGGDLLVAYSGRGAGTAEEGLLSALGLELRAVRGPAPVGPLAWWRHRNAVWRCGAGPDAVARPLEVPAPDWVPTPPDGAHAWCRVPPALLPADGPTGSGDASLPLAFTYSLGAGRVAVVPAPALANHGLVEPGHGDLLASLGAWLRGPWLVDEYHHGLRAPVELETAEERLALDLVLAHLLGLYLLGVWVLGRRFGPAWREPPTLLGSTGSFFRNLGRLHHELGHHREGARLLVERRAALEGAGTPPVGGAGRELDRGEVDAGAFLALARELAPGRRRS